MDYQQFCSQKAEYSKLILLYYLRAEWKCSVINKI